MKLLRSLKDRETFASWQMAKQDLSSKEQED